MYVIGTAGHVDHGKSTLIEAITGRHPDRLAEERERELSIVLGFDSMTLESGEQVGIIDVPGHRDFIENMLSGIGGIDAVLFVVAADEGVMPQTEEHLAIIDLLGIDDGVVALTKVDAVDDAEWLELVAADLQETLQGTTLENAPIVRVSGKTGQGVDALIRTIEDRLASHPPRPDLGRPRLSVDRTFTISGFGTVVTGTLLDGEFQEGEEIVLLPKKIKGRIRGLQVHDQKVATASPGSRTAINISGVNVDEIDRGDMVAHPGDYQTTRRLDVRYTSLPDSLKPLTHDTQAKLFLGADEVMARIRLLGQEQLAPGEEGWLQLEVPDPVVALRGDRYILRRPSPSETMGGGIVLDPHPEFRHKRFDERILERLRMLAEGDAEEIIYQVVLGSGVMRKKEVILQSNMDPERAQQALQALQEADRVLLLDDPSPDQLVTYEQKWDAILEDVLEKVADYHQTSPLRPGMPLEEIKSQLDYEDFVFQAAVDALVAERRLDQNGPVAALPDHAITFSDQDEERIKHLMIEFSKHPHTPPTVEECEEQVGEEVYQALISLQRLKQVSEDVVFTTDTYRSMVAEIRSWLEEKGTLTVAEARDHFNSSRRYVLALLEHLDTRGVTVREGDVRRLR